MTVTVEMRKQSQRLQEKVCKKDEADRDSIASTVRAPALPPSPQDVWFDEYLASNSRSVLQENRVPVTEMWAKENLASAEQAEVAARRQQELYNAMTPFERKYFSQANIERYPELAEAMRAMKERGDEDEDVVEVYKYHWSRFVDCTWCSKWDGTKYDVVFFGVSGYTGYLMMEYLKRVALKQNPESFSFAFAGRTPLKVMEMRDREFAGSRWEDTPIIRASFDNVASIIDLVKSARVVVNVAGPYMLTEGEVLVDACCHFNADYVDISGEIPWSLRVQELHKTARDAGVTILPSAALAGGYPDLGVFLCAQQLREAHGEELRHAVCYAASGGVGGGPSGGTLKTRQAMSCAGDDVRKAMADPFSLGGFIPDRDRHGIKTIDVEAGTGRATARWRPEDLDSNMAKISHDARTDVWRAPYLYAYFDTRVVRRANALHADLGRGPLGRELSFKEYTMLPPVVAAKAALGRSAAVEAGASVQAERAKLQAQGRYYREGEGPDLEELTEAWNGFFFHAESASGNAARCCFVGADQYFETARIAIEAALTLCFDRERLPCRGGVLTASTACGECLVQRLIASGLKFKMGSWIKYEECRPPRM